MTDKELISIVDAKVKKLWNEINTGHEYSIIESYNQFYGICMEIAEMVQEEPVSEKKCMFTKDSYADEDRKVLCEDCKEKCEYSKKEEPVSEVWHDMSESVENGRNVIIIDPADFYGAVLRKGGSQLKNHNKERYVKWAYIDDLQNLSNVRRTVKDWKEEPIIEVLDRYLDRVPDEEVLKTKMAINEWFNVYFPKLQKEPVREELEEAAVEAFKKIVDSDKNNFFEIFKAGAEWQKAKEESVTQDLGEYINELSKQFPEVSFAKLSRISVRVAKWQIAKLMKDATEVIVHIDAGGYPYIPQMELYDYDKDIPLAKEGDKYKIILIKEE